MCLCVYSCVRVYIYVCVLARSQWKQSNGGSKISRGGPNPLGAPPTPQIVSQNKRIGTFRSACWAPRIHQYKEAGPVRDPSKQSLAGIYLFVQNASILLYLELMAVRIQT